MRLTTMITTWLAVLAAGTFGVAGDVQWRREKLDDVFRSEGVAAADFNHDGKVDVVAGDVWYEAPDWHMHELRPVGKYEFDKGYSQSFADFTADVNGDGWDDVIIVGFPGAPFNWYENPQNKPDHWKEHLIWDSACNESPDFEDVTGDGKSELVLGSQPESKFGFLQMPDKSKANEKWKFHAVSVAGDPAKNGSHKFYHGSGVGDFNGDGRTDLLIPHGWWEAPPDRTAGEWTFHPFTLSEDGKGDSLPAANMYVEDLDLDGDNDIIMSSPHSYGIYWFENQSIGGNAKFDYHLIDKHYSQTHAMEFVDVNGDGQRDIVTGKRFFAHQGHDPGGHEPVVMYWYEIKRTKGKPPEFTPHEIVAGRDTGIGTQFLMKDMNGDGLYDVVLSNKKGVNVLVQEPRR